MKKVALVMFIVVLIFSCQKKADIKGHWHIKKPNQNSYFTIDVLNDTLAYAGMNSLEGRLKGKHILNEKFLQFPSSCGAGFYRYEIKGQKIFIVNALESKGEGYKCDSCCNKVQDFLMNSDLKIDFPIIKDSTKFKTTKLDYYYPMVKIQIGKPKPEIKTKLADSIVIDLYNIYTYVDTPTFKISPNIRSWYQEELSKNPHQIRKSIAILIDADKNVPISKLKRIIQNFTLKEQKRIFIQVLKNNYKQEIDIFEFVSVSKIDINSPKTIGEYLKQYSIAKDNAEG